MAALNFPNSPAVDDIHTENGTSWKWTGYIWRAQAEPTGGGASVTCSTTAPASPVEGDQWFDTTYGVLRVYFDSTWIDASGIANVICSSTPPAYPTQGFIWFNTTTGVTSTYFDGYWIAEASGVAPNDYITFRNLTILNL